MLWKYATDNDSGKHQRLQIGVDSRHNLKVEWPYPHGTQYVHRSATEVGMDAVLPDGFQKGRLCDW